MRCARLAAWAALTLCDLAGATTYRCVDDAHVTYGNRPCARGTQTEVGPAASAEDQATAAARSRIDSARLADLERSRRREQREDERVAAAAARRDTERSRQANACTKLALRSKRAHEDYDTAAPRDLPSRRTRMRRADDDYGALCTKH